MPSKGLLKAFKITLKEHENAFKQLLQAFEIPLKGLEKGLPLKRLQKTF